MHVFCDFDGTISENDTADHVFAALAHPDWEAIEEEWKAGKIGSGECMRRQIALIQGDPDELDAVLDKLNIDPGFGSLVEFCQTRNIPLTIVSDGIDYFISRILSRHKFNGIPVLSNQLTINNSGYTLNSIHSFDGCATRAGVCKCEIVKAVKREDRIYIGDGRSDFCVADKNDVVFAKGKLAAYCEDKKIPYKSYATLYDVTKALQDYVVKQTELELT